MIKLNDYKNIRKNNQTYSKITYLNTAAFGPMPRIAFLQQLWHLYKQSKQALPTTAASFKQINDMELEVNSQMAEFFDCNGEDIILNQGITESIYFALNNIVDIHEAEIVIPEYEFSSLLIALQNFREQHNLKITVIPLQQSRENFIKAFKAAITRKTALVMMSHVNYLFGKILPLAEIIEHASKFDVPVFVDGAQAAGAVDFSLSKQRPSYYAGTFVKWLHGPVGHGFLYIDKQQHKKIKNYMPGRRACENQATIFSLSDEPKYNQWARKAEASTYNFNNLFFLNMCLKNQLEHSLKARIDYVSRLRKMLVELLKQKSNLIVHDETDWDYAGIITIGSEKSLSSLYEKLLRHKIITKYFPKPNLLRISLCYLNNSDDVYRICKVLDL
ncbi:MAG: aminotransferase class V-fold PLP-dependent enzyme [Bacteroidales bacterium]|nr:aminotransferase class V-fold PLP-dependent enzyme [Bacteroidales bacterium]